MSSDDSSTHPLEGGKLGSCLIMERIGRGGMADVFLGYQETLHRQVAVKVLRPDLAASGTNLQRFMQEARAAAGLVHPNIVQIFDIGREGSWHYIAQEYVAGANLREYIRQQGPLPINIVISIMMQVGVALQKAASAGITHRDIKPENILLTKDGEVKVADFGLARAANLIDRELTRDGMTLGTPLYMSPEQIQGTEVDPRSDLYSLGVTTFHMLTGHPPFEGETPLSLAMQHLQNAPPDPRGERPEIPTGLAKIILTLLSKQPKDRFDSATTFLAELRQLKNSVPADQWPEAIPSLQNLPVKQVKSPLLETTLRLQAVTDQSRNRRRSLWAKAARYTLIVLLGLLGGGILAGQMPRRNLLGDSSGNSFGIPKQTDVRQQYTLALLRNTESHWLSVPYYFPPEASEQNRAYCNKAMLQLARWCGKNNQPRRGLELLDKMIKESGLSNTFETLARLERASIFKSMGDDAEYEACKPRIQAAFERVDPENQEWILANLPENIRGQWSPSSNLQAATSPSRT